MQEKKTRQARHAGQKTKFFVKFFRVIRNKKVAKHIHKNSKVLDVGCGRDFYLLREVENKITSGIGVDDAVKSAKQGKLTIRKMRIGLKLPFKSGVFDVVTMIAFIEHIDRPDKILSECNRVLRKNGIIIITTPMPRAKPFWEALVKLGFTEEKTTEDHKQYFTPEKIENLLRHNNFSVSVSEKFEMGMNYIAVGRKK